MKIFTLLLTLCSLGFYCNNSPAEKINAYSFQPLTEKIKGISLVAPSDTFSTDPMIPLHKIGASWVAVTPFAFSKKGEPDIHFDSKWLWWGDRTEGTIETIRQAKENNLKVMLKPQIWIRDGWVGNMTFDNEKDWQAWESSYTRYISTYAKIADSMNVEIFCIGTEYKLAVQQREKYWRGLIRTIKKIYSGKITYAANWDEYPLVSFWDELDFVGIDSYFPLVDSKTPTIEELKKAWKPIFKKLKKFHEKTSKPIIFTEYGYMSIDGCAHKNWELESIRTEIPVNEQAQANAIEAVFEIFWEEDWWGGSFLWKWYPYYVKGGKHEWKEFHAADYSPQGKIAEKVLTKWFKKY